MTEIDWQEPPDRRGDYFKKGGAWGPIADALRANPRQWARIREATTDAGFATRIKRATTSTWGPPGAFEAKSTGVGVNDRGQRVVDIYARYVGGGE